MTGRAGKVSDQMLDKISDLIKERDLLRAAIAAATARYERSTTEESSFTVASEMYLELAVVGETSGGGEPG